jgi:hypothetical protein
VQYTVCNFIYAYKQSTAFPAPIFTKFTSAEQHNSIRIGVSHGCHVDNFLSTQVQVIHVCGRTKNVENRGTIGQGMWDI